MNYAGIKYNDIVDGEGICVSLWTQGCPHKCKGCHNPETWDKTKGIPVPADLKGQIIKAISANGIKRNFSVLGGEPLADYNLGLVEYIVSAVRIAYPDIKIYLWTGYTLDSLQDKRKTNEKLNIILNNIDVLIDGPYIEKQRDLTLPLRGSKNQNIYYHKIDF